MKQETLEEVAEKLHQDLVSAIVDEVIAWNKDRYTDGQRKQSWEELFDRTRPIYKIINSKWQSERMYSEEDVRTAIFKSFLLGYDKVYSNELEDIIIEQFKKEDKQ